MQEIEQQEEIGIHPVIGLAHARSPSPTPMIHHSTTAPRASTSVVPSKRTADADSSSTCPSSSRRAASRQRFSGMASCGPSSSRLCHSASTARYDHSFSGATTSGATTSVTGEDTDSDESYGGPRDLSLLWDYGTHIAKYVWKDKTIDKTYKAKCLRMLTRSKALTHWKEIIARGQNLSWYTLAAQSGLLRLMDLPYKGIDKVLISAFVERWHPETNSFHFSWGEITITLHDVHQILKLPIEGRAMHGALSDHDMMLDISERLGYPYHIVKKAKTASGFHYKELNNYLWSAELDDDVVASGFLAVLLASTLFPDKSGNKIKLQSFQLLWDHNATGQYAWGAATLAYLYRQLGMASRADAAQISGCLLLLHDWIWSYFPKLRGHLNQAVTNDNAPTLNDPRTSREPSAKRIEAMRISLDLMRPEEVVWMPWKLLEHRQYCVSMYRGTLKCINFSEPYMPDRVTRQFGKVQQIPDDPIRPTSRTRNVYLQSYEAHFSPADDHWDDLPNHQSSIMLLPLCQKPWDTTEGYIGWLHKVSHLYLDVNSAHVIANAEQRPVPAFIECVIERNIIQGIVRESMCHWDNYEADHPLKVALQQISELLVRNVQPVEVPTTEAAQSEGYVRAPEIKYEENET